MTTIAAVSGPGWAVMGCDSLAIDGSRKYVMAQHVAKVNQIGPYLVGIAGDIRLINHVASGEVILTDPPRSTLGDLDAHMATTFRLELAEAIRESGYVKLRDWQIVVAVHGVLFEAGPAFDFVRTDGATAIGSGGAFALGYLAARPASSVRTGSAAVTGAVNTASQYDPATGGPVRVFTQRSRVR